MSTYKWIGGQGTIDPNDATQAANWLVQAGTAFIATTLIPTTGDTALVPQGTLDAASTVGNTIDLRSQVINVTGSNVALNFTNLTIDTASLVEQTVGTAAALNLIGGNINKGQIAALTAGGTLTVTASANGATAGLFANTNLMFAAGGGTLVINSGANAAMQNYGGILAYGGNVVLNASVNNTSGNLFVGGGSTFEANTAVGGGQALVFLDTAGTVKVDPGFGTSFFARLEGFQNGDTIALAGIPSAGLVESFNNGTLTLTNALSVVVATLRFGGSSFGLGTFQAPAPDAAGTGTLIKTQTTVVTPIWVQPSGGSFTGNFSNAAQWSTGLVPQSGTIALITAQSPTPYTVTIAAAQTVTTLLVAAQNASVVVASGGSLTVVNAIEDASGVFAVAAGGAVTATVLTQTGGGGDLELQAGAVLRLTGGSPSQSVSGRPALVIENIGTFSGATMNAAPAAGIFGGDSFIGSIGLGSLTVQNGSTVTDTYTGLGNFALSRGTLNLTGATTRWTDGGGDATTTYSGGMLVGGGGFSSTTGTLSSGGAGVLSVDQGAILTEANFAVIGYTNLASGAATVSNGARWNIGTGTNKSPALTNAGTAGTTPIPTLLIGDFVTGTLAVTSGSTVQLGGALQANTYSLALGYSTGSTGSIGTGLLTVSGAGSSLDTGGGAVVVGLHGVGTLSVLAGATMTAGSGGAVTGFNAGAVLGSRNTATGIGNGVGLMTIDGAGSLFSDSADFIDGRDGIGTAMVQNAGSLAVAGTLYIGGSGTVAGLSSGDSFSLASGGRASVVGVKMWNGNTLSLSGTSALAIGTGAVATPGAISVAAGATLQGAGLVSVTSPSGAIVNGGVVMAGFPGATLELAGNLQGSGIYVAGIAGQLAGAVLRVDGSVAAGVGFQMGQGAVSTLVLPSPASFQGVISQFFGTGAGTDVVDLINLSFVGSAPQLTYLPNVDPTTGGNIRIVSAAGTNTLAVTGYHPGGFTARADGGSGTAVVANDAAACFAAGTRILTTVGEVAVEALRVGDQVATLDGRLRPVRWIGQTRIDLARHPRAALVGPVRIAAEAFGPGMPHRDLLLSPDHAVHVAGALIPVHLLVNGSSIARAPGAASVVYFHVELDGHAVLLAEGLAAESYLDTGNRGLFEGSVRPLHPDPGAELAARAWDHRACAMLLLGGPAVATAHARLSRRAEALDYRRSADSGLSVEADGVALPATRADGVVAVRLPAGVRRLRLRARSSVPREADRALDDRRSLGVAVAGISFRGAALELDGAVCDAGFYPVERDGGDCFRWTDGAATLLLPDGGGLLELRLLATGLNYAIGPAVETCRARQA